MLTFGPRRVKSDPVSSQSRNLTQLCSRRDRCGVIMNPGDDMVTAITDQQQQIAELCRRYSVRRLDVVGSAASGDQFDPQSSDLDFLVEFSDSPEMGPADQYFGLLDELQQLFGRKVDLVSARSLRNRYFIESINRTKQVLYAS